MKRFMVLLLDAAPGGDPLPREGWIHVSADDPTGATAKAMRKAHRVPPYAYCSLGSMRHDNGMPMAVHLMRIEKSADGK